MFAIIIKGDIISNKIFFSSTNKGLGCTGVGQVGLKETFVLELTFFLSINLYLGI